MGRTRSCRCLQNGSAHLVWMWGGVKVFKCCPALLCKTQKRYLQPVATMQRRRPSPLAPVEELGNLSSPWLPGYKIICHMFLEKGAWLGWGDVAGGGGCREIVSTVGINECLRSYHTHLYHTGQPHCPAALSEPWTAGAFLMHE